MEEKLQQLAEYRNTGQWDKAFPLADELAEEGYLLGVTVLGECYLLGVAVPRDEEKGLGLLKMAAENQYDYALNRLAEYYGGMDFNGLFTYEEATAHVDHAEEIICYTKAARLGNPYAQQRINSLCYGKMN